MRFAYFRYRSVSRPCVVLLKLNRGTWLFSSALVNLGTFNHTDPFVNLRCRKQYSCLRLPFRERHGNTHDPNGSLLLQELAADLHHKYLTSRMS
jgi:hypothetical protein